jgi:hypothetical protein
MGFKSLVYISCLISLEAFSAACCGGGASLPNLITGDFKAQLTLNASNSAVTHRVDSDGNYIKSDKNEITESLTLMGAYQFDDLWQVGVSIPYKKNTYQKGDVNESTSGLGDLKLQVAYEFLPEYSYSKWKPRGFVFIQHTFNNAKSTHEFDKEYVTDALGKGFQTTSIGTSFFKIIRSFDISIMGEFHRSQVRSFSSNDQNITIKPGDGNSLLVGGGYSPRNGNLRFGLNLVSSSENESITTGDVSEKSTSKETLELGINLGYMLEENSYVASYTDQSFFGYGKNTSSAKVISLSIVHFLSL